MQTCYATIILGSYARKCLVVRKVSMYSALDKEFARQDDPFENLLTLLNLSLTIVTLLTTFFYYTIRDMTFVKCPYKDTVSVSPDAA